ncbi:MAG: putative protein YecE [Deltaproteobacteria bacterium]|nr:putative protein YecE [Deltaproteobacteria bacterium]
MARVFYPKRGKIRIDEREFYAAYFNSVEINSTFYRPASVAMARGWATKTPADFVFTVKAWQKFTHAAKLADGAHDTGQRWPPVERADSERFSEGVASLVEAGRRGALLFQLSGRKSSPPYRKVKTARRQLAGVEILRVLQQPRARASSRQWVDVAGGFAIGGQFRAPVSMIAAFPEMTSFVTADAAAIVRCINMAACRREFTDRLLAGSLRWVMMPAWVTLSRQDIVVTFR